MSGDEEREPLLQHQRQSEQQEQQPATPSALPGWVRMVAALRVGQMPDNRQLNTMFEATSAFMTALSDGILPKSGTKYGADTSTPVSNETVVTLSALLKECATFSHTLQAWVNGSELTASGSSTRPAPNADGKSKPDDAAARGNANEQWQRMIWHVAQCLSDETPSPVKVEVQGDGVQSDAKEAIDSVKQGVEQVTTDVSTGFKAISQIISLICGSDSLLRIPSDLLGGLQRDFADVAGQVSQRAANVEQEMQPKTTSASDEYAKPLEAVQEMADKVESAVEAAITPAYSEKGKERSSDNAEQTWEDEVAQRMAGLIEELRGDEAFRRAANVFIKLSRKYMQIFEQVRDDVQTHLQTEGTDISHATEEARDAIHASVESTLMDVELSTHLSHHASNAAVAIKEVLEGLAGGRSLDVVIDRATKLKEEVQSDSELRKWYDDFLTSFAAAINGDDASGSLDKDDLKRKFSHLYALLDTRPAVQRAYEDLRRSAQAFSDSLRSDDDLRKIKARLQHITAMTKQVFFHGVSDAKEQASFALSSLLKAALPSLEKIIGSIPLPRVEFKSDELDAALDDIHIGALQLLPDTLRMTTTQDWYWHKEPPLLKDRKAADGDHAHIDTDIKVSLGGLRLSIKDVSFYAQERFTAPSSTSCFACCSFGHSDSKWCLLRGPSSWFAYTERALLDVGFSGKGVGISLDVRDAGQELRKRQKYSMWPFSSKSGKTSVDVRDQTTERYRTIDEQEEEEEEADRTSFFTIQDCRVDLEDALVFNLHNSRHWIVNTILGASARPVIRLLIRRVVAAYVRNTVASVDQYLFDIHRRAKLTSNRRRRRNDISSSLGEPLSVDQVFPAMRDYLTVLFNENAGKSKARLARERQEQREKEEEERRQEDEEAHKRLQAEREEQPEADASRGGMSMEVKRAGVILHDEEGEYSIAIGVKPSGLLLNARQRGPMTQRMRVREAMAHPKQTMRQAKLYGEEIVNQSKNALLSDEQVEDDRDLLEAPKVIAQETRKTIESARDAIETLLDPAGERPSMKADDGWRSDAFDI